MFEVEWTGAYPCLCFGEWIVKRDGIDISYLIPENIRHYHMNTYRTNYEYWTFSEDWEEEWTSYEDGLRYPEWCIANSEWIYQICTNPKETEELYKAINERDWRHGSCGGCI